MGYITVAELRAFNHDTSALDPGGLQAHIDAATAKIDGYCGRYFTQDGTATARLFNRLDGCTVIVDDISTTSGLIVKTDRDGSGNYNTTLSSTQYVLRPTNGYLNGLAWPYTSIRTLGNHWFNWAGDYGPEVQVTAKWGWAAVPEPVKAACKLIANKLYKSGDAALGVAGFGEFGSVTVRDLPDVAALLAPYRKTAVMVA